MPHNQHDGTEVPGLATPELARTSGAASDAAREAADKNINTLRAKLAINGYVLHIVDAGDCTEFLVGRWGLTRTLCSLAELERFAAQAGAS